MFSAVQRQQRKNDVMTSFGLTACSAIYYHAGSSFHHKFYPFQKKYFAETLHCWIGWPHQHVSSDLYWYYMIELGFYMALAFSLMTDVRRKVRFSLISTGITCLRLAVTT
jgi:ceramide synthetase